MVTDVGHTGVGAHELSSLPVGTLVAPIAAAYCFGSVYGLKHETGRWLSAGTPVILLGLNAEVSTTYKTYIVEILTETGVYLHISDSGTKVKWRVLCGR